MTEPTHGPTDGPTAARPSVPTDHTESGAPYVYPIASTGAPGPVAPAPLAPGVALADEQQPAGSGGRRRTGVVVGALATVLVLGGAGLFAAQKLGGGGAQPADVLPADAYAYLRLDIDPSAGQKVSAVRFLGKLKDVRDTLGSDDPRKKLWELASKDADDRCLKTFSYDTDVAPWLGDRAGAAIRPGGTSDKPNVAVAIQVKDEGAAQSTLTRLFACEKSNDTEVRMKDGYAIITPKGTGDATLAAASKGTLAQKPTFTQDMNALGEQGVVSAWFDMATGLKEIQKLGGTSMAASVTAAGAQGRFAAALRFDPDYVELAGVFRGGDTKQQVKGDGTQLASLPANTMAALHVSGADAMVDTGWPELEKQLAGLADGSQSDVVGQIEQQFDVKLPADLKVLLGRSLTAAMPEQSLTGDSLEAGVKIVSSNAKRADEIISRLAQTAGAGQDMLTHKVAGNTVFVATTPDYADDLQAGGRLGDTDTFKAAMGDTTATNVAVFLDLDKLEKVYLKSLKGDERNLVESMKALGMNVTSTGNGEATVSLRVLSN